MLNSPPTGIRGDWPIYYDHRFVGIYQGTIDPGLNPNVRICGPKAKIGAWTEGEPIPSNSVTVYHVYLIPLHAADGSVTGLQVNSLEGLRYLDNFHPTDNATRELPR